MIIYLYLQGRIGNQLFQYAFARMIQKKAKLPCTIVIDETRVRDDHWINSLHEYNLPDACYVNGISPSDYKELNLSHKILKQYYKFIFHIKNSKVQHVVETIVQPILNGFGVIAIKSGYSHYFASKKNSVILDGYFQCEKYFKEIREEICQLFDLTNELELVNYPYLDILKSANAVCVSIKIEHNLGNTAFNVCSEQYYHRAIDYICERIKNPVIFLCSDQVETAREKFFPGKEWPIYCQPAGFGVHHSLAAMSLCRNFVINNTSFGWWAQYLCKEEEKIVVAPSRWKRDNSVVDIYYGQRGWHLVDVD